MEIFANFSSLSEQFHGKESGIRTCSFKVAKEIGLSGIFSWILLIGMIILSDDSSI